MATHRAQSFATPGASLVAVPDLSINVRSRPAYTGIKRTADMSMGVILLLALLPLFLIVGLAIVIDSGWPIFYRGERVGLGGRTFTVFKFRSMRADADSSVHREYLSQLLSGKIGESRGLYKVPRDPRITRVGAFIRKTSLDEFPQLVNVVKGEMSLVGPRPEVPYALADYEPWMYRRFEVTPGMTGLWQVSGRGKLGVRDMLRLDVEYADRCGVALDIRILMRTVPAVLRGTGAG